MTPGAKGQTAEDRSISGGREFLAIPGPSVIPQQVLAAMSHPMIDIYDGELVEVSDRIFGRLPKLAGSSGELFTVIGNGHAAWEMSLSNTMSRGDTVLVANSGVFAAAWGELAAQNGLQVQRIDAAPGRAIDPCAIAAHLEADRDHLVRAVLTVHSDTASSTRNDIAAVRQVLDDLEHPALLFVDCIASLGCERFEMDAWGVDLVVAACQKGLMTPPGVAFTIAGPRALHAHRGAGLVTYYWDWTRRQDTSAHYHRYCGTPPVSHLFGLDAALDMIENEGLDVRYERHRRLAAAVHAAVDEWSEAAGCALLVAEPSERSNAVTTVTTGDLDAAELRRICRDRFGVVLGVGLRDRAAKSFRIGHMGYVNEPMVLGTIGAVDATLKTMGIAARGLESAASSLSIS